MDRRTKLLKSIDWTQTFENLTWNDKVKFTHVYGIENVKGSYAKYKYEAAQIIIKTKGIEEYLNIIDILIR